MADTPYLSIVIPVYNEEKVIGLLIDSINKAMRKYQRSYEILIVNDGSTDKTPDVLTKTTVRVVNHPYNIGNGAAVKTGIRSAKG